MNKVLLVGTKDSTYIGKPVVTNAAVHAVVEEQVTQVFVFCHLSVFSAVHVGIMDLMLAVVTVVAGWQGYCLQV